AAGGATVSEKKLAGKVAIVTGGARGLGRGYALRLAGLGADIAIVDRNLRAADVYEFERRQMTAPTAADECRALGVRAVGLEADLTDRVAAEKIVADIVDTLGRIDVVVCNAGGGTVRFADEIDATARRGGAPGTLDEVTTGTPADCEEDALRRVLEINLM